MSVCSNVKTKECQICQKGLSKTGSHFVCQGSCQGTFHRGCVKGLAADMKAGINKIYCHNCEDETEEEVRDIGNILKDIQKKVGALPGLKKRLDSIQQSISVLSEKYDTLIVEHKQAKDKISKLEKTVVNLNNKCIYLEKSNQSLDQKVHDFEQSSRKHNLEIVGVEYLPGENVKDIVSKIGKKIGESTDGVEWIRRSKQHIKPGMQKPPSIIVGFRSPSIESRDSWLVKGRKAEDMYSGTVTGGSLRTRIYINEDLTKTSKTLLWNAKKQLHGVYKYVWVSNCKILVKKAEGDKSIWIREESDLNELLKIK